MKLSMWMIANRLSSGLDITCEIAADDAPVRKSARLAYATDCVYVYASGEEVIYQGGESRIRLRGISLLEGFEILQGIFDEFREWEEQVRCAVMRKDFQKVIDRSRWIFQNPMILLDGNHLLLGISSEPDPNAMDEEWQYLCRNRHSSVRISRLLYLESEMGGGRYHSGQGGAAASEGPKSIENWAGQGVAPGSYAESTGLAAGTAPETAAPIRPTTAQAQSRRLHRVRRDGKLRFGGTSCSLMAQGRECGRLTILEKNRPLTPGDEQLAEVLCEILETVLGQETSASGQNVFYKMLFGGTWSEKELALQLSYQQWRSDDLFQIALIEPGEKRNVEVSINLLMHAMLRTVPGCVILRQNPYVILIANWELSADVNFHATVQAYISQDEVRLGFSLPASDINALPFLFHQADYAMQKAPARRLSCGEVFFMRDCGARYLFTQSGPALRLRAVHPAVRKLWEYRKREGDELYETLKVFLDAERSYTRTAALLHTHRNTVLYRIRKAEEILHENLEDALLREYIRLSMLTLEEYAQA